MSIVGCSGIRSSSRCAFGKSLELSILSRGDTQFVTYTAELATEGQLEMKAIFGPIYKRHELGTIRQCEICMPPRAAEASRGQSWRHEAASSTRTTGCNAMRQRMYLCFGVCSRSLHGICEHNRQWRWLRWLIASRYPRFAIALVCAARRAAKQESARIQMMTNHK